MKLKTLFAAAFIAAASTQFAGCASSPTDRTAGQFVDDSALTARVKADIARDAGLHAASNVDVTTYRGVVQLSGFVDSQDTADRAVAIAKQVDGVRSVENDLHVAPKE